MSIKAKIILALAPLLIAAHTHSTVAQTAEVDADFSKYCHENFANSIYRKSPQAWGTKHSCYQGATPQGIDLARACELTAGSRQYRVLGSRVLCTPGTGNSTSTEEPLTPGDLVRYCKNRFPGSSYQHIPENFTGPHFCRRPGGVTGFTLQPIFIADACAFAKGDGKYRKAGNQIICQVHPAMRKQSTKTHRNSNGSSASAPPSSNRSEMPQSLSSADNASNENKNKNQPLSTDQKRPQGIWEMTAGVLTGMKVKLAWSENQMKGVITELPAAAEKTARTAYGLKVGDAVLVGRVADEKLKIRTRLGVVGTLEWIRANCNNSFSMKPFAKSLSNRWSFPGWYPVHGLTLQRGEIIGRHGGFEFVRPGHQINNICYGNSAPFERSANRKNENNFGGGTYIPLQVDPSIRLPNWAVKFELTKVVKQPQRKTGFSTIKQDNTEDSEAERERLNFYFLRGMSKAEIREYVQRIWDALADGRRVRIRIPGLAREQVDFLVDLLQPGGFHFSGTSEVERFVFNAMEHDLSSDSEGREVFRNWATARRNRVTTVNQDVVRELALLPPTDAYTRETYLKYIAYHQILLRGYEEIVNTLPR